MGALAVVGAAVTAISTAVQASANARQAAASEAEGRWNEALARSAEADAFQRGAQAAGRARIQGTLLAAEQQLAFSNSGVDATSGTPASVVGNTMAMTELDAQMIQNNAAREAWGFKTQGRQIQQQAQLDRSRLESEQVGTVLGGLGRVAGGLAPYFGNGK